MKVYKLKDNELFIGGCLNDGVNMPYDKNSVFSRDLRTFHSCNQASSLLFSTCGTIIYSDRPFTFCFDKGTLTLDEDISIEETGLDFISTIRTIRERLFRKQNRAPRQLLYENPQFNTWIEMEWNCTEEKVISYAEDIIAHGYKPGVFMIDDCWCKDYGVYDFDAPKFPHPKEMIDKLHSLGFKVMLWLVPFVSPDSSVFRCLESKGLLCKDRNDETMITHWWNGYSAALDLTNKDSIAWIENEFKRLIDEYKVDGFKMDGADPEYYLNIKSGKPYEQAREWCLLGEKYDFTELRVGLNCFNSNTVHRLRDKNHSWQDDGINALIPNAIVASLIGYPYICPDMIGGGMVPSFHSDGFKIDEELFVRYSQVAACFPMMQFSLAPWKCLSTDNQRIVLESVKFHETLVPLIDRLWKDAKDGVGIIRSMAEVENDASYLPITDQFFLGDDLLLAPIITKGGKRKVVLPKGKWFGDDNKVYEGGEYEIVADLKRIPHFKRIKGE